MRDKAAKGRSGMEGNTNAAGHKQGALAKFTKAVKSTAMWKSRNAKGNGGFKLTNAQCTEIRMKYRRTSYLVSNANDLAKEYNISRTQVIRIVSKGQRKHD